nr:protein DpdH [Streptomonospora nanhaiensis]
MCWTPENAATTINTEAISPSPAVFLATHAPLRIRRARIQGRRLTPTDTDSVVDETTVLGDFLNRRADTGALLMPVVGDSGSGKSHLVRWVREQVPPSDKRQVIYLEKSRTSLKAVIEELLRGIEDDALTSLRNDINSFSEGADETAVARRLINALNESLAATSSREMSGDARVLVGPRGLATILQDPYIQEHMLAPGRFVPQLAHQLLHNRESTASERPPGFTVDDLPLDLKDPTQAAKVSAGLMRHLVARSALQAAAVDLLNQHLEAAVRSVANLGTGRLHEAMLQVRQAYARQGKEIVLLIEDFALIQGVQRELLDAVTEAAHREGRVKYAPVRTLMAVTTGYFQDLPETAMTRVSAATAGYVYDLDVPFSEDDIGTEPIASFVGRYLNAARLGREAIERLGGKNAPNQCETCPVMAECHNAFGVTQEGYGLYPFNRPALVRAVHSVAPANQPLAFIPRTVLGSVVRPVLVEHASAIAEGTFPDSRFRERFRQVEQDKALSTPVSEKVDLLDELDGERRKLLLEFWGDAPDDPRDIEAGILGAFAFRPLPQDDDALGRLAPPRSPDRRVEATEAKSVPSEGEQLPESLRRRLLIIEEWASREKVLPQAVAREIRGIVMEAVRLRYRWQSPPMKEITKTALKSEKVWQNSSVIVSIEGAGGENRIGADSAPIRFRRSAANSLFFQSLVKIQANAGRPRAEDVRRLARLADVHARTFNLEIRRQLEIDDSDLVMGIRASLLGAALAGQARPDMSEQQLLSAALDYGEDWQRQDHEVRIRQWNSVLEHHVARRRDLVERLRLSLGVAQGTTGAVRLIDAARALPLLREAASVWRWVPPDRLPSWIADAVRGFSNWESLIEQQVAELSQRLDSVRKRLPAGDSGREAAAAVAKALDGTASVGLGPSSETKRRLTDLIDKAAAADWQVVGTLEGDLTKVRDIHEGERWEARVIAASRDRGESLHVIHTFLIAGDTWLDEALAQAAARSDSLGDSAAERVQGLLDDWGALVAEYEKEPEQ